jgi:predicted deacetylase
VCVVLHDVAASTRAACVRTLAAVAEVADVPVTLLAVPRYHGDAADARSRGLARRTRARRATRSRCTAGVIATTCRPRARSTTLRRRHYTRSEGEFWALPEAEARSASSSASPGFASTAGRSQGSSRRPGCSAPARGRRSSTQGFEYTATLRQLFHLPSRRSVASQSVVYSTSSGWRRKSSLLWNPLVARFERRNPVLRIELHPRDADFSEVRQSWQTHPRARLRNRRAVTVAEFMRHDRPGAVTTIARRRMHRPRNGSRPTRSDCRADYSRLKLTRR